MSSTRFIDVLRSPGVVRTFGTALIARSAYALVFLPLLYAVLEASGSIAVAGVALALYGAAASFLAPVRAWLIDRYGARPVLPVLIALFGSTLIALSIASLNAAPTGVLLTLGTLAGCVAAPIGPTMRVAWTRMGLGDASLRAAFSLDTVADELLYLAGPAIAGLVLTLIAPGAALLVPAALLIIGGSLFLATPAVTTMGRGGGARSVPREKSRLLLAHPRFLAVVLVAFSAGAVSGTVSVGVPAILPGTEAAASVGIALAAFAGGSAVGGLIFGKLRLRGDALRQALVLAAALLLASGMLAIATGVLSVTAVLIVAGLFFSPVMIVAYLAAHSAAAAHEQNAAMTWVNTGHNVGSAAASALTGVLVHALAPAGALAVMSVAGLAIVGVAALLSLRAPAPAHSSTD